MKTFNLKVAISNKSDMNDLVDKICEMTANDPNFLRDKFKMKTQADLKKTLDLCKFLKLKFIFDPTGDKNSVVVEIPESKIKELPVKQEAPDNNEDPFEELEL